MANVNFKEKYDKARALEAKAKRLRRKRRAAQVDACGKALLKYFPDANECNSVDEVFAYVSKLKTKADFADEIVGRCDAMTSELMVGLSPSQVGAHDDE